MIALDNGDKIRGDAAAANEVDFLLFGFVGAVATQLADGQLAAAIGDLYTAAAGGIGVSSIVLVNTGAVARAVNLYLTPNAGVARRLIPEDYSLGAGLALYTDGKSARLLDTGGAGGVSTHDILDGSVHPDSVADAVTRGSIIIGNATPKWDELVIGAADRFLGSDGTDPAWAQVSHTVLINKGEPFTQHLNNPCCRAYNDGDITIGTAAWAFLALNQERFDTDGIHDLVVNNSRLTCQTSGIYQITGQWSMDGHAVGRRLIGIRLNGVTYIATCQWPGSVDGNDQSVTTLWELAATDYVELGAYQNSGVNLDINAYANLSPAFMMVRVG